MPFPESTIKLRFALMASQRECIESTRKQGICVHGEVHVNPARFYFVFLNKAFHPIFNKVSKKYLSLYYQGFSFHWNRHKNHKGTCYLSAIALVGTEPFTCKHLTSENS